MNILKIIFTVLIIFSSSFSFSQQFETIKISKLKKCYETSIAWVKNKSVCLQSETANNDRDRFTHNFLLYDSLGALMSSKKIKTGISFFHPYSLRLNNSIVFFYDKKDDYGLHTLNISTILTDSLKFKKGMRGIFKIKASQEGENIDKDDYTFNVIKSVSGNKALLTYTNDYKSGSPEKIRFRIIDENHNLSIEDTLVLPYEHKKCSILETIYDDIDSSIYIIGNLFSSNRKKDKEFGRTFLVKYKISNYQFISFIDPIPALNNFIIQWRVTNSELILSGLHVNSYDTTGWSSLMLVIDKQSLKIKNRITSELQPSISKKFRSTNKKVNSDYIAPWNIIIDGKGAYHSLWVYYGGLDNAFQTEKEKNKLLMVATLLNLPGVLMMLPLQIAYTSGMNEATALLWIVNSGDSLVEKCIISHLNKYSGCFNAFSALSINDRIYCIYNNSPDPKHESIVSTFNYYEKSELKNDTIIPALFPKNIFLYPWSEYSSGDSKYYIGQSLPDPKHNIHKKNRAHESYIIRINKDKLINDQ